MMLEFKKRFPDNFKLSGKICSREMLVFERVGDLIDPLEVLNFPTKRGWCGKSKISYIKDGLEDLVEEIGRRKIKSIAIPALGCGLGVP